MAYVANGMVRLNEEEAIVATKLGYGVKKKGKFFIIDSYPDKFWGDAEEAAYEIETAVDDYDEADKELDL